MSSANILNYECPIKEIGPKNKNNTTFTMVGDFRDRPS
jgi:hypothetical protein